MLRLLPSILCGAALSVALAASEPKPDFAVHLRVDSRLVLVPVTVTDRSGRAITGLERRHFELFEDHSARDIVSFSIEQQPCSLMVVFDLSGSMRDEIQKARSAMRELFRVLEPEDEVGLITFAGSPHLRHDFSSDPEEVGQSLMNEEPNGSTALIDAVYLGLSKVHQAGTPRKALLVISDGADNHSRYTPQELMRLALEADAQVYTIGIRTPPRDAKDAILHQSSLGLLESLASNTGGLHFTIANAGGLEKVMGKIASAIRSQYLLGFLPSELRQDGKYRRIKVKVNAPEQQVQLRVTARPGYHDR
jgi:Ca-activated chloride channel family protein